AGHRSRSWCSSFPSAIVCSNPTARISRVIAIANTPSLNASTRPVSTPADATRGRGRSRVGPTPVKQLCECGADVREERLRVLSGGEDQAFERRDRPAEIRVDRALTVGDEAPVVAVDD